MQNTRFESINLTFDWKMFPLWLLCESWWSLCHWFAIRMANFAVAPLSEWEAENVGEGSFSTGWQSMAGTFWGHVILCQGVTSISCKCSMTILFCLASNCRGWWEIKVSHSGIGFFNLDDLKYTYKSNYALLKFVVFLSRQLFSHLLNISRPAR